ncbi:MAG: hypothetical protein M3281_04750, partial [Chloroflexota bacterium]|nr:hypothetical protein [Chloroflexota bacterium]
MTPCRECGRVNPPEATYCMTCAARLPNRSASEPSHGDDSFSRREQRYEPEVARATEVEHDDEGRFERVAPLVEDFVFDVIRAGAKLYFAAKDPAALEEARDQATQGGQRLRFERFKDALA